MRIAQHYVSKSVSGFEFGKMYKLKAYHDRTQPAVFFGCYRYEDRILIEDNISKDKVIYWTGMDALKFDWSNPIKARNVTPLPKVHEHISQHVDCELIRVSSERYKVSPQRLGNKIYAYCPNRATEYYGVKVLDELRRGGYEIVIGDGQWTQEQWKHKADFYYRDIFIGLCLSGFAGGGGSVIEMGVRGVPVVTNVLNLPNCLKWRDVVDVADHIEKNRVLIGKTNEKLAQDVFDSLDDKFEWLFI